MQYPHFLWDFSGKDPSPFSLGSVRESCIPLFFGSSRGEAAAQGGRQSPAWSPQKGQPCPLSGRHSDNTVENPDISPYFGNLEAAVKSFPSTEQGWAAPGHLHTSFPGSKSAPSRAGSLWIPLDPGWIPPHSQPASLTRTRHSPLPALSSSLINSLIIHQEAPRSESAARAPAEARELSSAHSLNLLLIRSGLTPAINCWSSSLAPGHPALFGRGGSRVINQIVTNEGSVQSPRTWPGDSWWLPAESWLWDKRDLGSFFKIYFLFFLFPGSGAAAVGSGSPRGCRLA